MKVIEMLQHWMRGGRDRDPDALPGNMSLEELNERDRELQERLEYLQQQVDVIRRRNAYQERFHHGR
jgi:hypothetical protein